MAVVEIRRNQLDVVACKVNSTRYHGIERINRPRWRVIALRMSDYQGQQTTERILGTYHLPSLLRVGMR
jgi:hypothetical protein